MNKLAPFLVAALLAFAPAADAKSSKSSRSATPSKTTAPSKPSKPATPAPRPVRPLRVQNRPVVLAPRYIRASVRPQQLPHHVYAHFDQAVLLDQIPRLTAGLTGQAFTLKRGTYLRLQRGGWSDNRYYRVMIDDEQRYPAVSGLAARVTGHHLTGYILRRSTVPNPPPALGVSGADQLWVKQPITFQPSSGAPIQLPAGTRLWSVTGLPGSGRFRVRLDDLARFPDQTRGHLEGYVSTKAVSRSWPPRP